MSITKDFEKRRLSTQSDELKYLSPHGTFVYWGDEIERLLKHTRALEAMLKKHEWNGRDFGDECPECHSFKSTFRGLHHHDCQLAKLIQGIE